MKKEVSELQKLMKAQGLDAYVITSEDYHGSEYVNDHFTAREHFSGFTGSAGTLVILADEAALWTDSRYFLQAADQLAGSDITLMREHEKDVPTIFEYLENKLGDGCVISGDLRTFNYPFGHELEKVAKKKNGRIEHSEITDEVWTDRPALSSKPVFILDEKYAGRSASDKIAAIREEMKKKGTEVHVLSTLVDIAWTLNLRGNDVDHTPVFYAYLILTADKTLLYIFDEALSPSVCEYLEKIGVETRPYDAFYEELQGLTCGSKVLACKMALSYALYAKLDKDSLVDAPNPSDLMKAIKNSTEIENLRRANVTDGAAMVRFLYWVKTNIGKIPMTEISATEKLDGLRKETGALDTSFETIAGYGPHGAIVHYSATPETDATLEPKGLFLVDSGGHYLTGTTDITRTVVLGEITEEMKLHFTLVLKGTLDLAMASFTDGIFGAQLDVLAHGPMWKYGITYKHGTGHGIGYLLSVHEGPQNISFALRPGAVPMQEGMLTSDEPGIYIEGSHGIRTENDILCVRKGEMLAFETLTLCPIDREAILPELLTVEEREFLNEYHKKVYEKLAPELNADEAKWLAYATAEI